MESCYNSAGQGPSYQTNHPLQNQVLSSNNMFNFSAIYGMWSVQTGKALWESFYISSLNSSDPWIIAGDFNTVRGPDERFTKAKLKNHELVDFNDFCVDMRFTDSNSHGVHYTWSNTSGTSRSKIDRVMINEAWRNKEWDCCTEFLPRNTHSDHSPSINKLLNPPTSSPKPFKFHNMWVSHPKFIQIVEEIWEEPCNGTMQYILTTKLYNLKQSLKKLDQEVFSGISARAEQDRQELSAAETEIDSNPENEELRLAIPNIRHKLHSYPLLTTNSRLYRV